MSEISITSLQKRYDIERTAMYKRLEDLGIKPVRRGRYSTEHLDILDKLDDHIKHRGSIKEFLVKMANIEEQKSQIVHSPPGQLIQITQQRSPIEGLRVLEEVCQNQWQIPTSMLKELLGLNSYPRSQSFRRGSFQFSKQGKYGRESAWFVEKLSRTDILVQK